MALFVNLVVTQLVYKSSTFCRIVRKLLCLQKPSLIPVLRQINPAHTLLPCIFDSLYNRIPLIWYSGHLAGTRLSNILEYETVPKFCSQTLENVHIYISHLHFVVKRLSF